MGSVCPLKMDRNMLQTTIPWVLPGQAQQPDINDSIHSVSILEHIKQLEQQDIRGESYYLPTSIRIWTQAPIQFGRGRTIQ